MIPGTVVWSIRPRPNSFACFELRPHLEQPGGSWREMGAALMATSKDSAYALMPTGLLLLFVTADGGEWWAPWWAPAWWWPNGVKPASPWDPPPVRAHWPMPW